MLALAWPRWQHRHQGLVGSVPGEVAGGGRVEGTALPSARSMRSGQAGQGSPGTGAETMDQPVDGRRAVTAPTRNDATLSKERRPMGDRTTLRRALVVGLAALAAALGLFTVLPASATHVTPTRVAGN